VPVVGRFTTVMLPARIDQAVSRAAHTNAASLEFRSNNFISELV